MRDEDGGIGSLPERIRQAACLDDLLPLLDVLERGIREFFTRERATAGEIQAVAGQLTQIRLLLNELEAGEVRTRGASRELAARYLELEGRIKELRNDLSRAIIKVR